MLVATACLLAVCILGHTHRKVLLQLFYSAIEAGEWRWKKSAAHAAFQSLARHTQVARHKWNAKAIIYVHVPRTGGDSMETHLFPTNRLDSYRKVQT